MVTTIYAIPPTESTRQWIKEKDNQMTIKIKPDSSDTIYYLYDSFSRNLEL